MKHDNAYEPVGEIVSIFLRGQVWCANYQLGGKQHRKSLKTSNRKEARRRAILLEADILYGRYKHEPRRCAIADVVTDYLKYCKTEARAAKTLNKYTKVMERVQKLAERLGLRYIQGIDLAFVDKYRQERAERGRAPKTIYNETMILRQLVNFALSRKMISDDPLQGLKVKEPKPGRQPCWSRTELDLILQNAAEPQKTAYTILSETGMRIGELEWLTWEDVDFDNNLLHVRPKPGWKPKTGDQRAIPLSRTLRSLLERLPRKATWVLTAPPSTKYARGDHQISERRLLKSLKRLLDRLGLQGHLHTFRHSFISQALLKGTPEAVVRDWVGHVDRDILKMYTHIADAESQAAMQRLGKSRSDSDNVESGKGDHDVVVE